jgi:serine phosphatase RsbU (regulator of sigma subunit)
VTFYAGSLLVIHKTGLLRAKCFICSDCLLPVAWRRAALQQEHEAKLTEKQRAAEAALHQKEAIKRAAEEKRKAEEAAREAERLATAQRAEEARLGKARQMQACPSTCC